MYPLVFVPVLSGRYRPLLQKVAKCKKYNKFKDFAFNTLAFQKVTNMTFKYSNFRALKSVNPKSSPPGPPAGALPLRRAPGPQPKSARAYALAMCAPRTCLPPKKNRLALTRSLCALRAHVCPKKIGPQQFKNRLAQRARYVRYAHMFAPP